MDLHTIIIKKKVIQQYHSLHTELMWLTKFILLPGLKNSNIACTISPPVISLLLNIHLSNCQIYIFLRKFFRVTYSVREL